MKNPYMEDDSNYAVNVGGCIGESTKFEIEYAIANGKVEVFYQPIYSTAAQSFTSQCPLPC